GRGEDGPGLLPALAEDELVEVGNEVPQRATLVTEGNAAIHAASRLSPALLRRLGKDELPRVVDALGLRALRGSLAPPLQEAGGLAHLVLRPGDGEHSEAAEAEARRRTRGASRGGVPRGTSSSGATRLRVAARGSAAAAFSISRSEHWGHPSTARSRGRAGTAAAGRCAERLAWSTRL